MARGKFILSPTERFPLCFTVDFSYIAQYYLAGELKITAKFSKDRHKS